MALNPKQKVPAVAATVSSYSGKLLPAPLDGKSRSHRDWIFHTNARARGRRIFERCRRTQRLPRRIDPADFRHRPNGPARLGETFVHAICIGGLGPEFSGAVTPHHAKLCTFNVRPLLLQLKRFVVVTARFHAAPLKGRDKPGHQSTDARPAATICPWGAWVNRIWVNRVWMGRISERRRRSPKIVTLAGGSLRLRCWR